MSSDDRQVLTFDPVHFLREAINDFLESGTEPKKIASAVIKVATGVELILKEKLELICPALILEKIDVPGPAMQVAKAFNLGKHLIKPAELDLVELKTANFDTLLNRAAKFIELSEADPHLRRLQKIRNNLVHHKGVVDMWQTNLLLVKHIFPFLQNLGKSDRRFQLSLTSAVWAKIKSIEKASADGFTSQLAKKIAYHEMKSDKLSEREVAMRIESEPEEAFEELINPSLLCPACRNRSLAALGDFDEEGDENGFSRIYYVLMDCRVCELKLEPNEVRHILENFEAFFEGLVQNEKPEWEQATEPPSD